MLRLQITNYQSLVKANLVIDGLTILKGESNSGKSSVFKAICSTHNRFRMGSVRFGEDSAVVILKYGDDPRLLRVEIRPWSISNYAFRSKELGYQHFDKLKP